MVCVKRTAKMKLTKLMMNGCYLSIKLTDNMRYAQHYVWELHTDLQNNYQQTWNGIINWNNTLHPIWQCIRCEIMGCHHAFRVSSSMKHTFVWQTCIDNAQMIWQLHIHHTIMSSKNTPLHTSCAHLGFRFGIYSKSKSKSHKIKSNRGYFFRVKSCDPKEVCEI